MKSNNRYQEELYIQFSFSNNDYKLMTAILKSCVLDVAGTGLEFQPKIFGRVITFDEQ